ncbi:hypothetical protein ES706_06165 [subsurface metagenome]
MSEKKGEKKSEKRSHRSPTTRVITIPAQFHPLIEKVRERRGYFSQHECMGHILSEYFGTDGKKQPDQVNPDQVIKGVKLNG